MIYDNYILSMRTFPQYLGPSATVTCIVRQQTAEERSLELKGRFPPERSVGWIALDQQTSVDSCTQTRK